MDLNDYWQENKQFVINVAVGLLVFWIGLMIIDSKYDSASALRSLNANKKTLQETRFTRSDLTVAKEESEALESAFMSLRKAITFLPREEYKLQASSGSAANQYFVAVSRVSADLSRLASRRRTLLPDGLGLETVESTRADLMERRLEALDLIDRVVRLAIDSGVTRVDKIQVRLDPGIDSRKGLDTIERTEITFEFVSNPASISRCLSLAQSEESGQALPMESLDVTVARMKKDEMRAKVKFLIIRLHGVDTEEEV